MEVPEESFHWSSWDSRTCYPRRAFIQGLTDDRKGEMERWQKEGIARAGKRKETKGKRKQRTEKPEDKLYFIFVLVFLFVFFSFLFIHTSITSGVSMLLKI